MPRSQPPAPVALRIHAIVLMLAFAFVMAAGTAEPVRAQYLYLDANGDGANTAADVIAPSGTTTLEVWLKTDTNRDGSAAVCSTGEDLSILSYEFILHAENGKVAWGAYTNLQPTMTTSFGLKSSATEYHNGFGGPTLLAPGTYHLGTLPVSVTLGTPSISIGTSTSLAGGYRTSFGSQCSGVDFDNTLKLGTDWFDADGVPYGGTAQSPPVLAVIADMVVDEGATATQTLAATDADNQPLEFSKVSGPAYMVVATTDPGTGTAHATITLSPGPGVFGTATGVVQVTDGAASDEQSFGITVNAVNDPPQILTLDHITMAASSQFQSPVTARDPEGDYVAMALTSISNFVSIDVNGQSLGGTASDSYRIQPSATDVGRGFATIWASDGVSDTRVQVAIDVTGPAPAPMPPADLFAAGFLDTRMGGAPSDIALADIDGDGDDDVAVASRNGGLVEVYRSAGHGALELVQRFSSPEPVAVRLADIDRDGAVDLAFLDIRSRNLSIVRGPLTGGAPPVEDVPVGTKPFSLALADLNHDGWLDAVVGDLSGTNLWVLQGDGAGGLGPPAGIDVGRSMAVLLTGDWNGDSWTDVAAFRASPSDVAVLLNDGSGGLRPPVATSLGLGYPTAETAAAGDLDGDGRDDFVVTVPPFYGGGKAFRSTGDGSFTPLPGLNPSAVAARIADMDRDGHADVVIANSDRATVSVRFGDGQGDFTRSVTYRSSQVLPALATGDVDGDGWPDLIAAHGLFVQFGFSRITPNPAFPLWGGVGIHLSRGNGAFGSELVSSGLSQVPVLQDFNHDGHLDLGDVSGVSLGRGDGTFAPRILSGIAAGSSPKHLAADLNGDGNLDVISIPQAATTITIALGDGNGGLHAIAPFQSQLTQLAAAVGDVNGDDIPDLVLGSLFYNLNGPGPMELWIGRGDGTFDGPVSIPVRAAVTGIRIADYDGDGNQDVIVLDFYGSQMLLLPGAGDGTFGSPVVLTSSIVSDIFQGPNRMVWGDMNGDHLDDVVVESGLVTAPILVYLQRPNHTLSAPRWVWTIGVGGIGASTQLADFDGDGRLDLAGTSVGVAFVGLGTGDGGVGVRRSFGPAGGVLLAGDVDEDGYPDLVSPNQFPANPTTTVLLNRAGILNRRAARAFFSGASKTLPIGATGRDVCLRVEPVGGSYANTDVDLSSLVMRSKGTGSVSEIAAIPSKKPVLGDADGNGIEEIGVCFASADLSRLFSLLKGKQDVPVTITGRLLGSPGRVYAEATLKIVRTGPSSSPTLSPNPLNPTGIFRFVTSRPGSARIQLFDVQGRLVRTLADRPLPAGNQEVQFDGKDQGGRSLASGVYFARIETVEGQYRMRVAIVK